ncbi:MULTISPECIES: ATP-grasp domain-containing protein [unclassified Streptomyces]|uniref:ATP-grasp domain-containing protein n=1 Tax=unclassified Streptomyces TaxID=2593676 RepID=UPI002E33E3AE|nr:ATP-grasp domain-containing protein [Streptomyces sp. NBC_01689]
MPEFQVAVVDAFGATSGFAAAFGAVGGGVIQVQSTVDLLPGVTPVDPAKFSHTVVHDGDTDALTEKIAALRPRAVLAGRESGVELADLLSERLGLPSNGTELSTARRDKFTQIERIRSCGLPAMRQIRTDDETELQAWHRQVGGPVVVKPLRSGGGDGVRFCDSPEESAIALAQVRNRTSSLGEPISHVVAQEYLVGAEYIVNTVSCEGQHQVTDVWSTDRITANGVRDLVVAQVLLPADDSVTGELVPFAHQVLDALGIRYGAAHLEIKLTPDGPRLVEAGARPSGLPYFVADVIGEGQLEWSVDAFVRPDRFRARVGRAYQRRSAFAWAALASPVSGRLVRYCALDEVRRLESFDDLTVIVKPGEVITATTWDLEYPVTLTLRHSVDAVLGRDLNTLRFLDGAGMYEIIPG